MKEEMITIRGDLTAEEVAKITDMRGEPKPSTAVLQVARLYAAGRLIEKVEG